MARQPSFNEAAGIPRGRHPLLVTLDDRAPASMRPRVFPAEDQKIVAPVVVRDHASMRPRVFPRKTRPTMRVITIT